MIRQITKWERIISMENAIASKFTIVGLQLLILVIGFAAKGQILALLGS